MKKKIINTFLTFALSIFFTVSASAISLPKAGGGGNTDELKLKFTKILN